MRTAFAGFGVVALLASSCALRPRYRDFVTTKTEGSSLKLLMTDGAGLPVANAKIELSELRNRQQFSTSADGTFALPVDKKYLDENPVLVVQLPPGSKRYSLAIAPIAPPLPDSPAATTPPPELPPAPGAPAEPRASPEPPRRELPTIPPPTGPTPPTPQ